MHTFTFSHTFNALFRCCGIATAWALDWSMSVCLGELNHTSGLYNRPPLHCGKTLTWSALTDWLTSVSKDECVFTEKWLSADCSTVLAQPLVLVSVTSLNSYNDMYGGTESSGADEVTLQRLMIASQLLLWLCAAAYVEVCREWPSWGCVCVRFQLVRVGWGDEIHKWYTVNLERPCT